MDHYTSGWSIEDLSEFTKQGKYSVQTYNAISTKVRSFFSVFLAIYYFVPQVTTKNQPPPLLLLIYLFDFGFVFWQGLARFPQDLYDVEPADYASGPAQALLIRSHKLQESEVHVACRAIARCGAGTNKYVFFTFC